MLAANRVISACWAASRARATIRAAVIAAIKDAGYLHVPEGRRDHTTPAEALPPRPRLDRNGTFTEHAGALKRTRQAY